MNLAVPIIQLIAYVMLTLASTFVAAVSAFIAYRSNFGWKPLVLVTSYGFQGTGGSKKVAATVKFEFWNRRKYPISIRYMTVALSTVKLRSNDVEPPWHSSGQTLSNPHIKTLPPDTHEDVSAVFPMEEGTHLDDFSERLTITITYFDPRRSKTRELRLDHLFKFS